MSIDGKSIIITGAGSGIGRSAALQMGRLGGRLLLADVNDETLAETTSQVKAMGGQARAVRADVSIEEDVVAMVAGAVESYGRLDCAFNNAAVPPSLQPLHEISLDLWQRTIGINLTGVFLCNKHEVTAMLATGGGSIVNVSSPAGVRGYEGHGEYMAAKHGLHGVSLAAAAEYGRRNIRVNTVIPGGVRTEMMKTVLAEQGQEWAQRQLNGTFLGRFAEPEEISAMAIWLFSDAASYVTGALIAVDGGMTAKGSAV